MAGEGAGRFVDTNIFLYVIQAHEEFGKTSLEILKRIDKGELAITSHINILEVCWWLEMHDQVERIEEQLKRISAVLNLGIVPLEYRDFIAASRLRRTSQVHFNDCLMVSAMNRMGIEEIYSNDRDFDVFHGIRRRFE
ncbi:MAG: type II toxin-antitoxin system VapC family toxin [Candidatus Thermoplasmatota archaeon]|nr:type II toxin-antitoxin system VapC family toxin [Candidatus Thermoplasmatota archaeon]